MSFCRLPFFRLIPVVIFIWITSAASRGEKSPDLSPEYREIKAFVQPSFAVHQTTHFTIFHHMDADWARRMGDLLEAFQVSFSETMQESGFPVSLPKDPLVWICFGNRKEFNSYARKADNIPIALEGYYSARTNHVAIFDSEKGNISKADFALNDAVPEHILRRHQDQKYIHEAAHQLSFNCGFLKRGVMYPLWISEGLATNFENMAADQGQLIGSNLGREVSLSRAQADGKLAPLRDFLVMTQISAAEDEEARGIYSQAWSVFAYALKHRKEELRAYLENLATTAPGWQNLDQLREGFSKAFGSIERFEEEWLRSIRAVGNP